MTIAEKINYLEEIIIELKIEYCENCQEWDCDLCKHKEKGRMFYYD